MSGFPKEKHVLKKCKENKQANTRAAPPPKRAHKECYVILVEHVIAGSFVYQVSDMFAIYYIYLVCIEGDVCYLN